MEIQEIIDYIEKTPANTNPNVLSTMLAELGGGGGGSALYKHTIDFGFGTLDDPDGQYFGATIIVNTNSQDPITTKDEFLEVMSKFGPGSVDTGTGVYKTTSSYSCFGSVIVEEKQYPPYGYSVAYWGEYYDGDYYVESRIVYVLSQILNLDFYISDTVTKIE